MNTKEIEYQSNGQPVAIDFEDLKEKLGYKVYKPRLGTLGKALLEAGKNQRSDNFLKRYCDSYFRKLRQRKRSKRTEKGKNKKKWETKQQT